jgi:hypothetical protein
MQEYKNDRVKHHREGCDHDQGPRGEEFKRTKEELLQKCFLYSNKIIES